jgi:hypothetical protein
MLKIAASVLVAFLTLTTSIVGQVEEPEIIEVIWDGDEGRHERVLNPRKPRLEERHRLGKLAIQNLQDEILTDGSSRVQMEV